jgi:membrane associated rhomboid family serine protease
VTIPPEGEAPEPGSGTGAADAPTTCYRHPGRETGVRCTRCERLICPECMVPAAVGFQCPECVNEGRKSVRPVKTVYGGTVNRGGIDATRVLVGINVVMVVLTLATGAGLTSGSGDSDLYRRFALMPPLVAGGEWYRLVTSMFLHFGFLHIAFNMWALLVIGSPLEQLLGRLRFLTLYFLSGIGGSLLSFALGPVGEVAAGASGAIFGLFGAFYVVNRHRGLETGQIVGLIAINLVISFTFSGIDWRGHVGGLVVGAAVAFALAWAPRGPQRDRLQALGCAGIALVLAASGFLAARHVETRCDDLLAVFQQQGQGTIAQAQGLQSCASADLIG